MVLVMTLIVLALVSNQAFAWGDRPSKNCRGDFKAKCAEMNKKLGITPEQEKLLDAQRDAHRKEAEATMKAMKDNREALKTEMAKPGITRQDLEPIVAEMKKLECDMVEQRVQGILKVKSILTPEQFEKLEKSRSEKQGRGKRGMKGMKHE